MPVPRQTTLRWLKVSELCDAAPSADASSLHNWAAIAALGSTALLRSPLLALFCSIRCPGNLILETYDLARALRDASVPVVSGFHTPMEKECMDLLLRGNQPIVACPARSVEGMRLPSALKAAVESGRLLFLSASKRKDRRPTAKLAEERNRLVVALAADVFVAFAAEGGKTEQLCRAALAAGRRVLTFDSAANARLIEMGGIPVTASELAHRWGQSGSPLGPNSEPSASVQ